MATGDIVKGKYLYLDTSIPGENGYYNFQAYATAHTLSMSAETTEVSHKTDHAGLWAKNEVSKLSWEATSENLFTEDASIPMIGTDVSVVMMYDKGAKIKASGEQAGSPTGLYSGNATITSLQLNGNVGDNATYSVTLTGNGALTAVTTA